MRSLALRLAALCAAAVALAPSASSAQSHWADWTAVSLEARAPAGELRHVPLGLPTLRSGAGVARSALMAGLRFWADGTGYAVGRRSAGYGLGAGAALPIRDSLALTAGYRVAGFSGGHHLDGDTLAIDGQLAGAYFGFDFEF